MEEIIIDIGSGNIKAYSINKMKEIKKIYIKNIMFKKNASRERGIAEEDKKELIKAIEEIKNGNIGIPIHAYATSVFRMLNKEKLEELQMEIIQATGIKINVISQQEEEEYMAKAVGNINELDEPYLVCCVGGSSTEMIVMQNGKIIEQLTEEFATGDMLKKFSQIAEDKPNIKIEDMYKYIEENFKTLPKTKCKYAIFTGFHLMYNLVAENKMNKNTFFERKDIPYYLTVEQFNKNNEETIKKRSLNSLKEKYPENPSFMNGTRGANTIVGYILEKVGAEIYFPTNLNMINGIVEKLQEEDLIKKLWNYMKSNQKIEKSDCIIGLGCEDLNIAKVAVDLYFKGYADKIIFSGGLGKVTRDIWNEPEANKFAKYAIEKGVPKERVYIENKSTNTGDNFRFTKELIKQERLNIKTCIVVCKPYVEKRVEATLKKIMPECTGIVTSQNIEFEQYCNQYENEIGNKNEVIEDLVGSVERMKVFAERGWQAQMDIPNTVWQAYEDLVKMGYDKYYTKKHKEL